MVGIERFDRVDFLNWDIDEAIPTSDIIWDELNASRSLPFLLRLLLSVILPFAVSCLGVFGVLYMDLEFVTKQDD